MLSKFSQNKNSWKKAEKQLTWRYLNPCGITCFLFPVPWALNTEETQWMLEDGMKTVLLTSESQNTLTESEKIIWVMITKWNVTICLNILTNYNVINMVLTDKPHSSFYLCWGLLSTRLSCDGEQGLIGSTRASFLLYLDPPLQLPRTATLGGSKKHTHG